MRAVADAVGLEIAMGGEIAVAKRRPYINRRGENVVALPTGRLLANGDPEYREQRIHTNATLRKDEWVRIDERLITAARERLVIIDDMRSAGLIAPMGGLGTLISEWEKVSEMTDAEVTMDGESQTDEDRVAFGINGVPIPLIQKRFRIGERTLLASRTRGAGLDVTNGVEAARAVARTSEKMVFNGLTLGASNSAGDTYQIYGLTTFPQRATISISDWTDESTTPEEILDDILAMVRVMETQQRHYGPFNLYIPGNVAWQFRRDFKQFGERTLMQRVQAEESIAAVRVSDVLESPNVVLVQMDELVLDLAVASDVSNIQWASGSGWTNFFQTFAAWAPRLKSDYDGRTGILHATMANTT